MLSSHLRTSLCAVHDGMTSIYREFVLHLEQSFTCEIVARVHHPSAKNLRVIFLSILIALMLHFRNKFKIAFCVTLFVWHVDSCRRKTGSPVRLHEDRWAEVFVRVPPVTGTGSTAACTQDALIQSILTNTKHKHITSPLTAFSSTNNLAV